MVKVEYWTESRMSTDMFKRGSLDISGAWEEKLAAALYPLVIGEEARDIIERVAGSAAGPLAREDVEEALALYFRTLGLAPRRVRWIERGSWEESCAAGFTEVWSKGLTTGVIPEEEARAMRQVETSLGQAKKVVEKVAAAAAYVGQSRLQSSYESVAEDLRRAEGRGPRGKIGEWIAYIKNWEFGWMLFGLGLPRALGLETSEEAEAVKVTSALASSKAISAGVWAATRFSANEAGVDVPGVDRMVDILMPFVDAVDQGLWLYWITPDEVIAVARKPG